VINADPVDSEGEDIRDALDEEVEAEHQGDEAREGGADGSPKQGEEAREGSADGSPNQSDEARQGGAEGEGLNPPANVAAPPVIVESEVNPSNLASAASAPRAAENADERSSVNLSELTLQQKREMLMRLQKELQAEALPNPTNLGSVQTRNNLNSSGGPSAMSGVMSSIINAAANAPRSMFDSTRSLSAGFTATPHINEAQKKAAASSSTIANASASAAANARAANAPITPSDNDRVDVSDDEAAEGDEAQAALTSGKEKRAVPTPGVRHIQAVTLPKAGGGRVTPPAPPAPAGKNKAQTTPKPSLQRGGQGNLTSFLAPQSGSKAPAGKVTSTALKASEGGAKKRGADSPLIPPPKFGKQASTHDERVSQLLQLGWRHADIVNALDASKDEEGEEDASKAHSYLEELRLFRLQNVNASGGQHNADYEATEKIREGGELALYIAGNPDHIDVVLGMQEIHERTRGSHQADHFRTAANLMAHPKVAGDQGAQALPAYARKKIALAIVQDCVDCEQLRAQEEKAKAEAEERARHAANLKAREAERKAEQEALRKKREDEEKAKRAKADAERPRTPILPADPADDGGNGIDDDANDLGFCSVSNSKLTQTTESVIAIINHDDDSAFL
jgi:hypothetical protein